MTTAEGIQVIADLKAVLGARGWLRATSGNLSVRLDGDRILITASGTDKQRVRPGDLAVVDLDGIQRDGGPGRPSAETALHLAVYRQTTAAVVLHVHTVFNNLVGHGEDRIVIADHEMLKALGHWDEEAEVAVPVLPNPADVAQLAALAAQRLEPAVPGFLVRRHGVYAWGGDADAALRHLEALEFLFEWSYYHTLHTLHTLHSGHSRAGAVRRETAPTSAS
jgi:methylthioribulose-1-phosphate dehydratase